MQPDYLRQAQQRQEQQERDYTKQRNPFEYGQQVSRRRFSEIMSGLDAQAQNTARTYAQMYEAAQQQGTRAEAMGGPTLSGGMSQQRKDYLSAAEMGQLTQIGQARLGDMAQIAAQREAAWSNAQLEGQQATQMELQNQQTQLQLVNQKNEILASEDLTDEQKAEQLSVLGYQQEADSLLSGEASDNEADALSKMILGLGGGAALGAFALGAIKAKGVMALAGLAFKFIPVIGTLALLAYGGNAAYEYFTGEEGIPFL